MITNIDKVDRDRNMTSGAGDRAHVYYADWSLVNLLVAVLATYDQPTFVVESTMLRKGI